MSTDIADAKPAQDEKPKKRGGQRGERPWRDRPTARERVLNGSLADYIRNVTGKDVSSETIRAVRFCLPKWSNDEATKALRENMDKKLEKAKLQDRRQRALEMLRETDAELRKYDSEGDLDDEEDEDDEDDNEYVDVDSNSDDSEDEEDDVFGDDEKVQASFG